MNSIASLTQRLIADFGFHPVTASEIEFYLHGSDAYGEIAGFWEDVGRACAEADIHLFNMEKERGREQHEISLSPCADPAKTAGDTQRLKQIVAELADKHQMQADFSALPLADQPGSGLHMHVHLEDSGGRNVFYKDDSRMSDALAFSIGGLLATMREHMPVFAPYPESRARFRAGSNAPLTVSWGANNRTTAIRLPDAPHDRKRLEHRVAGADADPVAVMEAILAGMHYGLVNHCDPGPQIYGDAALPMYGLLMLAL